VLESASSGSERDDIETDALLPKAETPREKNNRLKKALGRLKSDLNLIRESGIDQIVSILRREKKIINELSASQVEELVGFTFSKLSRKNPHKRDSYLAFVKIFDELSETAKDVVANCAFKYLKSKRIEGDYDSISHEILLHYAKKLAVDCPDAKSNWLKIKTFESSNRGVLDLIINRITQSVVFKPKGEPLTAAQVCALLNVFSAYYIGAVLNPSTLNEIIFDRVHKAITAVVTDERNAGVYPNLTTALHYIELRQFNTPLHSKKVEDFKNELNNLRDKYKYSPAQEVEKLQILITVLVDLIGTSRFHGKHEDMLELCLVRLAELSDFKKGLNLDPEILKKCLGIVDRYFLAKNRTKFFGLKCSPQGHTLRAFIRRTEPSFQAYKNLHTFSPRATLRELLNIAGIEGRVMSGEFEMQDLLLQTARENRFYNNIIERLVELGADMDRQDDRGDSFFTLAMYKLGKKNNGELWNFYLEKKIPDKFNAVLSKVIETYIICSIALVQYKEKEGVAVLRVVVDEFLETIKGCKGALKDLQTRGVSVTSEILESVDAIKDMNPEHKEELLKMLRQFPMATAAPQASTSSSSGVDNDNNAGTVPPVNKDKEDLMVSPATRSAEEVADDLERLRIILDNCFYYLADEVDVLVQRLGKEKLAEKKLLTKLRDFKENGIEFRRERLEMLRENLKKNKPNEANHLVKQSGTQVQNLMFQEKQRLWSCKLESDVREFLRKNGFTFAHVEERSAVAAASSSVVVPVEKDKEEKYDAKQKTVLERLCDAFEVSSKGIRDDTGLVWELSRKNRSFQDAEALNEKIEAFVKSEIGQNLWKDAIAANDQGALQFFSRYGGGEVLPAAAPVSTAAAVVAARPTVLSAVAPAAVVSTDLPHVDKLSLVLARGYYSVDVNPLVHAAGSEIQQLSPWHKTKLCEYELSDDTKALLRDNGFAEFLTQENAAKGVNARERELRSLQRRLQQPDDLSQDSVNIAVMGLGSEVKKLSPIEIRILCFFGFNPEVKEFLCKNIDYFNHFDTLVFFRRFSNGQSFLENLKETFTDSALGELRYNRAEALMLALNETEQEEFSAYLLSEEGAGIVQNFWRDAIDAGQRSVLGVLVERGVKINTMLAYASITRNVEITAFLQRQGLVPLEEVPSAVAERKAQTVAVGVMVERSKRKSTDDVRRGTPKDKDEAAQKQLGRSNSLPSLGSK